MAMYTANAPSPVYGQPMPQFIPEPVVHNIRDWLPWSIVNLIIGWGLAGIIPLIFSLICRSNKRKNDVHGAQLMSTLALVFNIIITIGGIASWIGFIIWIVFYVQAVKTVLNENP